MKRADGTLVPDFIIIGAMKSGTTTLDRLLREHPSIGMSRDKETDYFVAEKNYPKGPAWYAGQFDPQKPVHGEASPNYTKSDVFKGVAERIHAAAPDATLIFIARDPVDRAISQYRHSWTIGDIAMRPAEFVDSHEWWHIVAASRYAEQLAPYVSTFGPEQLVIVDFAELAKHPQQVMDRLCDRLGVARHDVGATQSHNEASELSKVPAVALRLAQSPLGKAANRIVSRGARDRVRRMLAVGKGRTPEAFPEWVVERLARDLKEDAARFRSLAGRPFADWRV